MLIIKKTDLSIRSAARQNRRLATTQRDLNFLPIVPTYIHYIQLGGFFGAATIYIKINSITVIKYHYFYSLL